MLRFLAGAAALLTLIACGGRSSLDTGDVVASTSTGAGGIGAGGGGGQGQGGNGEGGGPLLPDCISLEVGLGPVLLPSPDPSRHARQPTLVGLDGDSVALLLRMPLLESPGAIDPNVMHVQLTPWVGDSLNAAPAQLVAINSDGSRLAAAETAEPGHYALGVQLANGARLAPSLNPLVNYSPAPSGMNAGLISRIVAMANTTDAAVFAGVSVAPEHSALELARVTPDGVAMVSPHTGCATDELLARVAEVNGRALMAISSGQDPSGCLSSPFPTGAPTRLQTGFVEFATPFVEEDRELNEPITFLELVSNGERAWLFWTTDGSTSLAPPPIFATPLGELGNFFAPPVEVIPPEEQAAVGVATFGDGFVTASLDNLDPSTPTLIVRLFDGAAQLAHETALNLPDFVKAGALAVQVSPTNNAVLIGWTALSEVGGADPTGMVRFDCVAPRN